MIFTLRSPEVTVPRYDSCIFRGAKPHQPERYVGKNISKKRKQLLILMEKLIGDECYNGNIQNWGPGGIFEGAGRSFRYPITFRDSSGEKLKRWTVDESMAPETLRGGYYAFGANELHIMAGLERVLNHLEDHYGLKIDT
jgi:hypothetical protein